MLKRVFCPLFIFLFICFFPFSGGSQTISPETNSVTDAGQSAGEESSVTVPPGGETTVQGNTGDTPIPVSVMTFVGDDLAISAQLHDAVIREVGTLGNYEIQAVSEVDFPEQRSLPPDEPPNPWYLGNSRFVLTGEFYIDIDEEMQHFQLWLWRSQDGSLVYTDELVAEDLDEAMSYMPALVSWVFSRIPQEQRVTVVERQQGLDLKVQLENTERNITTTDSNSTGSADNTKNEESRSEQLTDPLNRWLYIGARFGGSIRFYGLPKVVKDYSSNYTQGFSFEVAVQVGFRFLSFLSVQGEIIYTQDNAPFRGPMFVMTNEEIRYIYFTDNYTSSSLMIPIVVKFHVNKSPFIISPFGGVYWAIPLGLLKFETTKEGEASQQYEYNLSSALGIAVGLDAGLRLGPGILFVDVRYAFDLGKTMIAMEDGREYTRSMLSFSLGYELALLNKKKRVNK
ncbi:MAG: outer membrane beta-barrel protein [Spirochaetaceae bacterium]|nr:outer membrane beta-barrel protein [Spirochaetaceae bacterium]